MKLRLPNPFEQRRALVRTPLLGFDPIYYLFWYPDVRAASLDPLQHYLLVGWKEGRDPSAGFSTSGYLRSNPDVAVMEISPLLHFVNVGLAEGRRGFKKNPGAPAPRANSALASQKLLPPPTATEPEKLQGFIDEVSHDKIRGWVLPHSAYRRAAEVEVIINGDLVTRTTAAVYRQDLCGEKIGTGCYGFTILLHPPLDRAFDQAVVVQRAEDSLIIGQVVLRVE